MSDQKWILCRNIEPNSYHDRWVLHKYYNEFEGLFLHDDLDMEIVTDHEATILSKIAYNPYALVGYFVNLYLDHPAVIRNCFINEHFDYIDDWGLTPFEEYNNKYNDNFDIIKTFIDCCCEYRKPYLLRTTIKSYTGTYRKLCNDNAYINIDGCRKFTQNYDKYIENITEDDIRQILNKIKCKCEKKMISYNNEQQNEITESHPIIRSISKRKSVKMLVDGLVERIELPASYVEPIKWWEDSKKYKQ